MGCAWWLEAVFNELPSPIYILLREGQRGKKRARDRGREGDRQRDRQTESKRGWPTTMERGNRKSLVV